MNDEWKKVEMAPIWDCDLEKELLGIYIAKDEEVGSNNSNLYSIQKADESVIGVWGNTLIDSKFKSIKTGDEVKIVYLGKATGEKSGREYKNFEVYHRAPKTTKVSGI